ncbi:MAG: nitroreductase [Ruminococcaceae bacterium]|nr:nitroreductase [Oscillospiraceae bacterium]
MNIIELIKSRRTIRKFEQKEITNEQLINYIDAARVAPSAANLQPLKYYVVNSPQNNARVFENVKWAGYLAPEYNPKEDERPMAYIVVCVDKNISKNAAETDVGASVENIILSALSEGVGACWMGAIDRKAIAEIIGLPENLEISCVVALGYPKENPREVELTESVKYYLDKDTLCVPKRKIDEVLIKTI